MEGFPEFHVGEYKFLHRLVLFVELSSTVYRDANFNRFKEYFGGNRISKTSWHSDVVREHVPFNFAHGADDDTVLRAAATRHDILLDP